MRAIVLGAGQIGSVIAKDFSGMGIELTIGDIDINRARDVAYEVEGESLRFDTADYDQMVKTLRNFDLVIGALPGDYGLTALRACIEARRDVVDVSFTPEYPFELNEDARKAGITMIPDCGVAPGLSNLLIGYGASQLDSIHEAKIMVGGIPEKQVPPLGYTITWSAEGLIDEYIRDVSIVKKGDLIQVPALSGLEGIDFPGVGKLEAFYTDGLRSLVESFPEVENLYEKTLRYPGHVEKVKLLRELGFFSEDPVKVRDSEVKPKMVSARILERSLTMPEVGDLLAMSVDVSGIKDGDRLGFGYRVLEYYDHEKDVSAMARTTAYTASIIARLVADGDIQDEGVVTMEKLGSNHYLVDKIFSELGKRGINVEEEKHR
ncbi:saccharopine dehydrogenase [Candidatus Bathyarchaeota archaeon]|nr:saccharopine dehydrogenase [Candidatus Bathyarchaeota archaeon]